MENFMIIHGSYGNPYNNWFPWLHANLSKCGKKCIVPSFPTPKRQEYSVWEKLMKFYIDEGYVNESTTVITHSMSCIFVVKFCVENDFKIGAIISTAGFNNIAFEDDPELVDIVGSFYDAPEKLARFKELCGKRIAFYSDNDPYVPLEKGKEFANMIDAQHMFMQGAGHFNWRSEEKEFREILDCLE